MKGFYRFLYRLALRLYFFGIRLVAPFHRKAKLMIVGRQGVLHKIKTEREPGKEYIWIHVSSVGEFEQARPLIEKLREEGTSKSICLTFFSPSGYELRKDYPLADIITYLPFDTSRDLETFIDLLDPSMVIFVKYEFWLRTLELIAEREIPCYLISSIFRPSQPFFKNGYGTIFRQGLEAFTHIFVQNEESIQLLQEIDVTCTTLTGDTRIDRVVKIAATSEEHPLFRNLQDEVHASGVLIVIFGSSWPADEEVYIPYLNTSSSIFPIIVPHEVTPEHIHQVRSRLERPITLLSEYNDSSSISPEALLVDQVGLLSRLYRYADIAYVGGGFGRGIHNTAEAAVYGVPVLFGPKHSKFQEAIALIQSGGGFAISNEEELTSTLDRLVSDSQYRHTAGEKAATTIAQLTGATEIVYNALFRS